MVGSIFGQLTVLETVASNKHGQRMLLCKCSCGTQKVVAIQSLKNGDTKSCGCYRAEVSGARNKKHGARKTKAFSCWWNMKSRCERPSNVYYKDYGGRGIKICERWLEFSNFLADMGQPDGDMSLERIDNDGDYELSNCRWVSRKEQANNRRSNTFLELHGERLTIQQWSERLGFSRSTIPLRLKTGWSVERALTQPLRKRN